MIRFGWLLCLGYAACSSSSRTEPSLSVTSMIPAAGAVGVERTPQIAVRLEEPLDPASVGMDQVAVRSATGMVLGTTAYDPVDDFVRWQTVATLPLGTRLRAVLKAGLRTASGRVLSKDVEWTFTVLEPVLEAPVALTVDTVDDDSQSVVALDPTTGDAVVAVGANVWVLSETATHQENFPFVPERLAVSHGGALAGARYFNAGTLPADIRCEVALRHRDGIWLSDDFLVATSGAVDGVPRIVGGFGDSFSIVCQQTWPVLYDKVLVGPRTSTPMFALATQFHPNYRLVAATLDGHTAVVSRGPRFGEPAQAWLWNVAGSMPQGTGPFERPHGEIGVDGTGALLRFAARSSTEIELTREMDIGLIDREIVVTEALGMLSTPRLLPGPNGGAGLWLTPSGALSSVRLDDSRDAAVVRRLQLTSDIASSTAWAAAYAESGTLWLVVRQREAVGDGERLQLWRQPADGEWQGPTTLVPPTAGRRLGLPTIAAEASGGMVIAVPRDVPNEVVVLRAR